MPGLNWKSILMAYE